VSPELILWMVAAIGIFVLLLVVTRRVRALAKKVAALEPLRGRSIADVIAALGQPRARVVDPDGTAVLTWNTEAYVVGIRFDPDGRCMGIAHEFRND
jgi:hypothetical protein